MAVLKTTTIAAAFVLMLGSAPPSYAQGAALALEPVADSTISTSLRLDPAGDEPDDATAGGQPAQAEKPPTPPHTGVHALVSGLVQDVAHLPSMPNAYIALIGGGLAGAVHPLDDNVNNSLKGSPDFWRPGKWVGQTPVQMGAALAVFTVGRIAHRDKVSHLGMDLLRAQIVTSGLTVGLKYATQRERPDGSDNHSFPSGHASITFASATVIERHLGWRYTVVGYAVASYVAASRLHDNRHWLSDVVFGSAVGMIGGRTVTQHGRNVWTMAPVPVPGGVAIMAMRTGAS